MTLSKLAQLANVSVSVVSKAFSGRNDISDAMREHVFEVARQYGCFQQFYHVPYDKPVIAVIVPEVISQYYLHYIEVLKKDIEENGYTMLLSISNFDRQLTAELVRYYTEHGKVDGLILLSGTDEIPCNTSTAIVSFGEPTEHPIGTYISSNLNTGVAAALSYLKSKGHQRIAYVGEPFTDHQRRVWTEEMEKAGLALCDPWCITSHARFEAAGCDGVRRIWADVEHPTAIFGACGYITRGILQELRDMKLSVPGNVAVISLDNEPSLLDPVIDIACIPTEIEKRCEIAMQALNERIKKGKAASFRHIVLQSSFYRGKSI